MCPQEIKPLNKSFGGLIAMTTMCINAKNKMLTEYLHGLECFPGQKVVFQNVELPLTSDIRLKRRWGGVWDECVCVCV